MATSKSSFAFFSLFVALFLSLNSSESVHLSSSSLSVASSQLNFWSQNVQNHMPDSILKKLSPMTRNDCNYYSQLMSKNDKFSADEKFCALSKLTCHTTLDKVVILYAGYVKYRKTSVEDENIKNKDPFSFFRLSQLKNGNLIHLPNLKEALPDRSFLPSQITSQIPLTSESISKIFPRITTDAAVKEIVESSISKCDAAAIKGEKKSCPKSLEEMISFTKSTLGANKLISLTSKSTEGSNSELMIKKIEKLNAEKSVACHELFFPFATYLCHSLTQSRLYKVDLVEPNHGNYVNTMLAVCHMDTSLWPKNHIALKMLKFGPGEGEVCHWFRHMDLAWISAN